MKQRVRKKRSPAMRRFTVLFPIILACIASVLGALVVIVSDVASASLPAVLKPYIPYAWPVLIVLLLLLVGVGISDAWYTHRQSARHATVPASQPALSLSPSPNSPTAPTPVSQPAVASFSDPHLSGSSSSAAQPGALSVPTPVPAASSAGASGSSNYHSCVLSYATEDQTFAEKLYADLQNKGISCWYAPHDLGAGDRLRPRIYEAIRKHEKLLLILSEHAIESDWVEREVELAFEQECQPPKTIILFPIRLDDVVLQTNVAWAGDIRRTRFIGDFRQWQDDAEYQRALQRLLRDLHV